MPEPSAPAPAPAPAVFPRAAWGLVAASAVLALGAGLAAQRAADGRALLVAVACALVGAGLGYQAHALALRAHARAPQIIAALLLGFLGTAVGIALVTTLLAILSPRGV